MIVFKEELLTCAKMTLARSQAGEAAVTMWLALKHHVETHGTDGFIAERDLKSLAILPKRYRSALKALVECGQTYSDGTRGAGLVERVEHGWRLHDYHDHSAKTPRQQPEADDTQRARERARKAEWRRRHSNVPAVPNVPNVPGDKTGQMSQMSQGQNGTNVPNVPPPPPTPPSPKTNSNSIISGEVSQSTDGTRGTKTGTFDGTSGTMSHGTRDGTRDTPQSQPDDARQHELALSSRESAEQLPIEARAKAVLRRTDMAQWCEPQRWPEVTQAVKAFDIAHGRRTPSRLSDLARDSGLRALLGLFADGYSAAQVAEAARRSGSNTWFRSQRRGLAALTPEVVRRLLDDAPEATPEVEHLDL
jgi:hypothetical protein